MIYASQGSKQLALKMRSRVLSSTRTGFFETFTVEVKTDEGERVTPTVGYDHSGKGMACSYNRPGMSRERETAVSITALDCVSRHIEERG